jgi:thioredoxin-dependent peroxiredoxin
MKQIAIAAAAAALISAPAFAALPVGAKAHLFADAIDKFKAEGATVIGVTSGNVDQLAAFSTETEHCSGKFPVAADPTNAISKTYDATLAFGVKTVSNRTSYVITPDDAVLFTYTNLAPDQHVALTLDAVSKWRAAHAH